VKIAVVGSAEDVGGFALAGLPGRLAETGPVVEDALRAAAAGEEDATGFLLVSSGAARLAPAALEALAMREGPPVVLALPEAAAP